MRGKLVEGIRFHAGDAVASGFSINETEGDGVKFARFGVPRPDFVVGEHDPFQQTKRNFTVGDIKLSVSKMYDDYIKGKRDADKKRQFKSIAHYNKRHAFRTATFITAVRVSRRHIPGDHILMRKALQAKAILNGIAMGIITFRNKDFHIEKP